MNKKTKFFIILGTILIVLVTSALYLSHLNIEVLNPQGPIATSERNLIDLVFLLSLLVIIPVFGSFIFFAVRYNEKNKKNHNYTPNWDRSWKIETIWWFFPSLLILVLSIITWNSTVKLAPYRHLHSRNPTMKIQVVAEEWKWLFIYPKLHIASVNLAVIPANTPIDFQITADAPMNSFWIPQLGGQIYAMAGMETNLNLMAYHPGNYDGYSANLSGKGFASMHFIARATTVSAYKSWVQKVRSSKYVLNTNAYNNLAKPSTIVKIPYYSSVPSGIFSSIIMKYMAPPLSKTSNNPSSKLSNNSMPGME